MARLVLGTDKSVRIPAIVVEKPTPMPLSIQKVKDANGKVQNGSTVIDLTGTTDVGDYVLYYAYYKNTNITGAVDLSALKYISGQYACFGMFQECPGITSVDLSGLTTHAAYFGLGSAFKGCTNLSSVDLSNLNTVVNSRNFSQFCSGCTNLTSVNLSSLTDIKVGFMFQTAFVNCTSLTTLSFPALTSTSFGSYTNQFNQMLNGVTGCTVHFPSNLQSIMSSWYDVIAGFGGTNTTVLFDLPATN